MKTQRWASVGMTLFIAALLLVASGVLADAPGEPLPGTVASIKGPYVFWNNAVIAGSTVTYTASPKWASGSDLSLVWLAHSADVFVTADVTPTGHVTVTPQFSADAVNWTDAQYASESWILPLSYSNVLTNASGVTNTTTSTATTTFASTTATRVSTMVTYSVALDSDTTGYMRIPLAGKYLRFKIEHNNVVTPTIKVMLRND